MKQYKLYTIKWFEMLLFSVKNQNYGRKNLKKKNNLPFFVLNEKLLDDYNFSCMILTVIKEFSRKNWAYLYELIMKEKTSISD